MSNVNMRIKVMDREVFWNTLETVNGYKFQHNKVVGQYRVVSPDKYRESWAFDKNEVYADFERISGKNRPSHQEKQQSAPLNESKDTDAMDKLERLFNLYTSGVIEQDEYEKLRKRIMAEMNL